MANEYYDLQDIEEFIKVTWPRSYKRAETAKKFYDEVVAALVLGQTKSTKEQLMLGLIPISKSRLRRKVPRTTNAHGEKEYMLDKLIIEFPIYKEENKGNNVKGEQTLVSTRIPMDILLAGNNEKEIVQEAFADIFAAKFDSQTEDVDIDFAPINIQNLKNYISNTETTINSLKARTPNSNKIKTYQRYVTSATIILYGAEHFNGELPMRVSESVFGRRYYKGPNLQSCPKIVREAALGPVWEVDISNSVFNWKYAQLPLDTRNKMSYIREYLESSASKTRIRKMLARATFGNIKNYNEDASIDTIKKVITSISFGAQPNTLARYRDAAGQWQSSSINDIIQDAECRNNLMTHPWMAKFLREQLAINGILKKQAKEFFKANPTPHVLNEHGNFDAKKGISMLYQQEERKIVELLTQEGIRHNPALKRVLLVHDGIYFNHKPALADMRWVLQQHWPCADLDAHKIDKWVANSHIDHQEQHYADIAREERQANDGYYAGRPKLTVVRSHGNDDAGMRAASSEPNYETAAYADPSAQEYTDHTSNAPDFVSSLTATKPRNIPTNTNRINSND